MNGPDLSTATMLDFLKRVKFLCDVHALSVTCWMRTPKRNANKGGKPNSWHLTGFAVDVVPDAWPLVTRELLEDIKKMDLHYLVENDHIHIQAFPAIRPS